MKSRFLVTFLALLTAALFPEKINANKGKSPEAEEIREKFNENISDWLGMMKDLLANPEIAREFAYVFNTEFKACSPMLELFARPHDLVRNPEERMSWVEKCLAVVTEEWKSMRELYPEVHRDFEGCDPMIELVSRPRDVSMKPREFLQAADKCWAVLKKEVNKIMREFESPSTLWLGSFGPTNYTITINGNDYRY